MTKAAWFNTVQRELVALVEKYGGVLDTQCDQQLYDVLNKVTPLRTSAIPVARITPGVLCFPEMLSANGCWQITANGNGTVTIDAGQSFIWRGVWEIRTEDYTTAQRTFAMSANKTYHLRWRPGSGFGLYDLGNHTYNPGGALSEADIYFDTQVDDMLIALAQTNASNIPIITTLANKRQLVRTWESIQNKINGVKGDEPFWSFSPVASVTLDWSRAPTPAWLGACGWNFARGYRSSIAQNETSWGVTATRYKAQMYDTTQNTPADISGFYYALKA